MRNIPEATEHALSTVAWGGLIGAILSFGAGFSAGVALGGAGWGLLIGLGILARIGGLAVGVIVGGLLALRGLRG